MFPLMGWFSQPTDVQDLLADNLSTPGQTRNIISHRWSLPSCLLNPFDKFFKEQPTFIHLFTFFWHGCYVPKNITTTTTSKGGQPCKGRTHHQLDMGRLNFIVKHLLWTWKQVLPVAEVFSGSTKPVRSSLWAFRLLVHRNDFCGSLERLMRCSTLLSPALSGVFLHGQLGGSMSLHPDGPTQFSMPTSRPNLNKP